MNPNKDRVPFPLTAAVILVTIVGLALLFLVSGCSKPVADDRTDEAGGTLPDRWGDATHVFAYRNVDGVPTVVLFCIDKYRFAATLSSGDGSKYPSPALLRLPEQDRICGEPQ